jgi:hypothetical protein
MRSLEEANLVRRIRREMDKRPLDFTRTEIEADKGRVRFTGTITFLKDVKKVRVRTEMEELCLVLSRMTEIRQISNDARMIERNPEDEHPQPIVGIGQRGARTPRAV